MNNTLLLNDTIRIRIRNRDPLIPQPFFFIYGAPEFSKLVVVEALMKEGLRGKGFFDRIQPVRGKSIDWTSEDAQKWDFVYFDRFDGKTIPWKQMRKFLRQAYETCTLVFFLSEISPWDCYIDLGRRDSAHFMCNLCTVNLQTPLVIEFDPYIHKILEENPDSENEYVLEK